MAKMQDRQIIAAIEGEESQALGWQSGELASRRSDALNAWLAAPLGNEVEGRSQIVSASVRDVVSSILPSLCRVFLAGDEVGRFEPVSQEDEKAAETESEVCAWYIERGGGWNALYSAFHDALLLANGYVKCWWQSDSAIVTETYKGQSDEELALLLQEQDVKVVEHSEYPALPPTFDPMTGQEIPGPLLHDVKVEVVKPQEFVKLEAVPPDEILVSRRHRYSCLSDADFVQHRRKISIGDLRALGYEVPDDVADDADATADEEDSRSRYDEDEYEDETGDPARRIVTFRETWIKLDVRGSGEPQLWRFCVVGKQILHEEEADLVPIAAFVPLVYPHAHIGVSIFDLIEDLYLLETTLQRALLDNLYLSNNVRTIVDASRVNLEDLLVSRPGGIVRTEGDPASAVIPLVHPTTSAQALQTLEYVSTIRENRTGITRYNQGLDSNSLNKTATGVSLIQSAAQGRLEIIARTLAEGVKDLYLIVHGLALKHSTKPIQIRLKNQWVPINPREWRKRTDFKTSVALGTGAPEVQLAKWSQFMQMVPQLMGMGMVGPSQLYEMTKEMMRLAGYRSVNKFLIEPQPNQPMPQQGPPPEVQAAQAMAQGQVQKAEVDGRYSIQKAKGDSIVDLEKEKLKQQGDTKKAIIDAAAKILIERERIAMQAQAQAQQQMMDQNHQAAMAQMQGRMDDERSEREGMRESLAEEREDDAEEKQSLVANLEQMVAALTKAVEGLNAPREIVRGPDGRAVGVRPARLN